jgi:hypothetical protein
MSSQVFGIRETRFARRGGAEFVKHVQSVVGENVCDSVVLYCVPALRQHAFKKLQASRLVHLLITCITLVGCNHSLLFLSLTLIIISATSSLPLTNAHTHTHARTLAPSHRIAQNRVRRVVAIILIHLF